MVMSMMTHDLFKRFKAFGLSVLTASFFLSSPTSSAEENNLIVLELFTSQGCSSCPPADALLGELDKRADILALSFPVDYWDYIGWKDTFASPEYTKRQRTYAKAQRKWQVYTPQMMINGHVDAVGSSRFDIERKIKRYKSELNRDVKISATDNGKTISLHISPETKSASKAVLFIAAYQKKAVVEIGRGENRGRTITYTNVVRIFKSFGTWQGGTQTIKVLKSDLSGKGINGAAALLQQEEGGPILAAQKLSLSTR